MLKLALSCALILSPSMVIAGQQYYEARSDAMGGAGVASSNREGAAFINPALLALHAPKHDNISMLIPMVGIEGADKDQMLDKFDALQDSFDALGVAVHTGDIAGMVRYRDELVIDLESLKDTDGYVSVGIGFSVVLPTQRVPMAFFYKGYIDAIGLAAIEQSDIDTLNSADSSNPPMITDLDSQGVVIAGAVSDLGVALSLPLSIVNMPITVGITAKVQRIDTYHYVASANNFDASDFDDDRYQTDETAFNLDVGVAIMPTEGLIFGVSGRNLIARELETIQAKGRQFTYRVEPLYTAGISYDWGGVMLTSDIDLNARKRFAEFAETQYWRVGGELLATDWLALRVGYRHDLKDNTVNIYSLGTGFSLGRVFNLDLSGMVGSDDAIGGVLQTSYHF